MDADIKYSVIIISYNIEKYLEESILSVINAGEDRCEIIVMDDGSGDHSFNIALNLAKKYRNIRVFRQNNQGPLMARQNGASKAWGKWITFLDGDDFLDKDFFRYVDDQINNITTKDMIAVNMRHYYENTKKYGEPIYSFEEKYEPVNLLKLPWYVPGKVFSREIMDKGHSFYKPKHFYEDIGHLPQLVINIENVYWIDKPLYIYRRRDGSTSTDDSSDKLYDMIASLEATRRYLIRHPLFDTAFAAIFEAYVIKNTLLFNFPKILDQDAKSEYAIKMFRYVERRYPFWYQNPYIQKMSLRDRTYLWLIKKRRWKCLHHLIRVKKLIRNIIEKFGLHKIVLLYQKYSK